MKVPKTSKEVVSEKTALLQHEYLDMQYKLNQKQMEYASGRWQMYLILKVKNSNSR